MTAIQCPVCGGSDCVTFRARERQFGLGDEFEYAECHSCGLVWLLTENVDWDRFYPTDYYAFTTSPFEYPFGFIRDTVRRIRTRYALTGSGRLGAELLRRSPQPSLVALRGLPLSRRSRILDVGSGAGLFLYDLRLAGYREAYGIDPYVKEDIRTLKGDIVIWRMELDQVPGSFDLITMNHAFEHMPDPDATLAAARERLRPNGHLVIRIPLADSLAFRQYRERWVQLDAPRHRWLHTERSMSILADRHGLELVRHHRDATDFQFTGSERYLRDIPLVQADGESIFSPEEREAFRAETIRSNERGDGDQGVFVYRLRP